MFTSVKILTIILLTALGLFIVIPSAEAFDPTKQACNTGTSSDSAVCKDAATQGDGTNNPFLETLQTAVSIVAIVGGVAAVILIIIGGITFITAGGAAAGQRSGDSARGAARGRSMIVGGVAGLIIISMAWAVTTFVVDKFIQ